MIVLELILGHGCKWWKTLLEIWHPRSITKAIKWNISGVPQNKNVRFSELTELYHPTFLVTTRMIILLIMCGHLLAIFFPSRSSEEESI
jgi:hypothetical protein